MKDVQPLVPGGLIRAAARNLFRVLGGARQDERLKLAWAESDDEECGM